MRYTPYSEAEIKSMNIMDAGTYSFQISDVETTKNGQSMTDKNGNEMCKLKLLVWDANKRERVIYTFISGDSNFAYKLRHFAKTLGKISEYEAGTFNVSQTIGLSGVAEIVIKKGGPKSDGSGDVWADRNDVKDFVGEGHAAQSGGQGAPPQGHPAMQNIPQQDVPF